MSYSDAGLAKTKEFEGLRLTAYQDIGGVWTIGYGHTGKVTRGMTITEEEATELLRKDVQWAVDCVNRVTKDLLLNQNQFDALVDFTFNVGCGAFGKSTLVKKLNEGDFPGAAEQFTRWTKVQGREVAGLLRRRKADQELFNTPVKGIEASDAN